jgi:hypothetical protein
VTDAASAQAKDKPYTFAILTGLVAIVVTAAMMLWGGISPESVLIGLEGRHDGVEGGERLAACLDCHVPFVGTPGSRCLGPGCHGELATGTPPKSGPAMPIRFHAVLRDKACGTCHAEHVEAGARTSTRAFTHELVPVDVRSECHRCHTAAGIVAHASADAVECASCHDLRGWRGVRIDHGRVAKDACDLCHLAPETTTHASVAGTCQECHEIGNWTPKPVATEKDKSP